MQSFVAIAASSDLAVFSFCIAAAAVGFLLYNFHPAKIFLGDAGSIPLGFAVAFWGVIYLLLAISLDRLRDRTKPGLRAHSAALQMRRRAVKNTL